MAQPIPCPNFFYPLHEHMPRITAGRFFCHKWKNTILGYLRVPILLGERLEWPERIRKYLGETYDPKTGQLRTNGPWHDICRWFTCVHMLDLVGQIPELVPWFSIEDFSRGVLTELLGNAVSPFEAKNGYSVDEVTPAFTILHHLGSFDALKEYCDIDDIAGHFVSLQDRKNGCFCPELGWQSGVHADAFQLQVLVGITLLDVTFGTSYMSSVNRAALRSHLTSRLRELMGKAQSRCGEWLFNLRNVIASLHFLDRRLDSVSASEATAMLIQSCAASVLKHIGITLSVCKPRGV